MDAGLKNDTDQVEKTCFVGIRLYVSMTTNQTSLLVLPALFNVVIHLFLHASYFSAGKVFTQRPTDVAKAF